MNRTMKIAIFTAFILSLSALAPRPAEAGMRIRNSRIYVMGYQVQGNFAIPILGVITDEVSMGVSVHYRRQTVRPPLRWTPNEEEAVREFLEDTLPPPRPPLR
jgi:hypothetical protein